METEAHFSMARRVWVFDAEGNFSHYEKKSISLQKVRDGLADCSLHHPNHLILRPAVLQIRGELNEWRATPCDFVHFADHGTGSRFKLYPPCTRTRLSCELQQLIVCHQICVTNVTIEEGFGVRSCA